MKAKSAKFTLKKSTKQNTSPVSLFPVVLSWQIGIYSTMAATDEADNMATDEDKKEKDENGEQKVSPFTGLSICALIGNLQTYIYIYNITGCSVVHEAVCRFILFKSTEYFTEDRLQKCY